MRWTILNWKEGCRMCVSECVDCTDFRNIFQSYLSTMFCCYCPCSCTALCLLPHQMQWKYNQTIPNYVHMSARAHIRAHIHTRTHTQSYSLDAKATHPIHSFSMWTLSIRFTHLHAHFNSYIHMHALAQTHTHIHNPMEYVKIVAFLNVSSVGLSVK